MNLRDLISKPDRTIESEDIVISIHQNRPLTMAMEMMRDHGIHEIAVLDENDRCVGILTHDDILSHYRSLEKADEEISFSPELKLEAKLRDAQATFNLLGIAFCEVLNIEGEFVIRWLNAEAMLTFGVQIDDSISKMFPEVIWDALLYQLEHYGGVDKERVELNERIYEVTLMEAEVLGEQIYKLFLNDVSELVRLGDELRRHLEERIQNEQERSKLYLEVSATLSLALDTQGNIVYINRSGCDLLGVEPSEVVGKNWFDTFVSQEDNDEAKNIFNSIILGELEMVKYYENRVQSHDGTKHLIAWNSALLHNEEGKVIGTFSSGDDITEKVLAHEKLAESEYKLEHAANYDPLTDLPNRSLLLKRLNHAIAHSLYQNKKVAVIQLNIDHFKDINESYGYAAGDEIIKEVAQKLSAVVSSEDMLAHTGGDEFIILLESLNESLESEATVKSLHGLFDKPMIVNNTDFTLSSSMGVAIYPDDAETGELLLKNADIALRRAKEGGRNNFCYFSAEMSSKLFERVLLERELRRAVDEQEFVVYYQPQVDLRNGKLLGAEALVRWQHPMMGIVSPDVFVGLCEGNNLIVPIGEQVLEKACKQVNEWRDKGLFTGRISVNVSGKQFEKNDVIETILGIVKKSGLPLEHLELEMTESVLMGNPQVLREKLAELRSLGIEVALDDFGTGYSSLSYLKQFPIDKLKIDQSFVRGIPDNEQDIAIIKAVIAMSKTLGLKTIAEGIEEKIHGEHLRELGCDQGQGYLYARPLSAQMYEELLRSWV